jgi:hypothetical protein
MKSIWKYVLQPVDVQSLTIPKGSVILTAQIQKDKICVWALVDEYSELETRVFRIIGTGHGVDDEPGRFLGTVQLHEGRIIFHIFVKED